MTTLLVQLTDPHICAPGSPAPGALDTGPLLQQAVARVLALPQRPDAVVITGDLADLGRVDDYLHLAELLAPLSLPLYLLPGNHDDRAHLRAAFPGHGYLGEGEFVQFSVAVGDVRLLGLDTSVPRRPHGELCRRRLDWLATELDAHRDMPVVVAMHHPPFRTGLDRMDRMGLLAGAPELEALLRQHPNVERVLCGHLHRAIDARFGGTIACTTPSTAHQMALDLAPGAPLQWTLEPPALRLLQVEPGGRSVSHLVTTAPFDGPFPLGAA